MLITISSVSPVRVEGKYAKMDIKFFTGGKSGERTLAAVGDTKKVIEVLKNAKEGEDYEVTLKKSDDDKYWNWVGAEVSKPSAAVAVAKSTYQAKSTYETPAERAKKNVYIVRQSSLERAMEFLNAKGNKHTDADVCKIAEKFVTFVFQTEGMATVDDAAGEPNLDEPMKDDNPF